MAFTQITSTNIKANTVAGYAEFANFAASLAPRVSYANVANSLYFTVDDTAVNVGGGYIVVTGANFQSGATVLIDTVQASAVTYVDSTTLRVQVPARSAATYNLYVVNPDGGTGIRVNGLTYSSEPTWVTASPLANQLANTAFNVSLDATGATSYAVAAGSTLPAGTTLAANGYFSGTVTIGAQTTYSFSIVATDAENQDSSKTFQVTVTVTPQGALYAWGYNAAGGTGLNRTTTVFSPIQVGSGVNWSDISAEWQSFGVRTDGTLWALGGRNNTGQLGLNDITYRSSPVQVGAGTNWSKVSSGANAVMALKTDGTLWFWGGNYGGINGQNDHTGGSEPRRSSPTQIGSNTNWSQIPNHFFYHTGAVKTDGTLWLWGSSLYGNLGNNSTIYRSSPTQIGATTNWRNVSTGRWQTLATKTDGTLWAWGLGRNGPLNSSVHTSSPVQVGTGTNWNLAVVGQYSALATKTDGTLWSWGNNSAGQGGINITGAPQNDRSSPSQVGTDTNWNLIEVGQYQSIATKTDGTLWFWGNGAATPFGNQTARSSPVQVGSGTTWLIISSGGNYTSLAVLGS